MNRTIDQLPEKTSLEPNDELILFDSAEQVSKKIKGSDVKIPFQYSTEEQLTGKYWVNGKPIYCKVYTDLSFLFQYNNRWYDLGISPPSNLDEIIYAVSIGVDLGADYSRTEMPFTASIISTYVPNGNLAMYSGPNAGTVHKIIIEYTKTTD